MALPGDSLRHFRPESLRGTAGFFRVGQTRPGAWWLITPDGAPFFATAVNDLTVDDGDGASTDTLARLRQWGFNTLGAGAPRALHGEGWPAIGSVDFCGESPVIHVEGVRLPDVFDPAWPDHADRQAARRAAPLAERTERLGWLVDDGIEWGPASAGEHPSLLQICLSLEPGLAAYHAAWEFVLAPHGGQIGGLAKAWGFPLGNKEVVRALTREGGALATRGHARDDARWTRECARRYFSAASAALRRHAPRHLVWGGRSLRAAGAGALAALRAECAYPFIDVVWVHGQDVPALAPGPLFAGGFNWVTDDLLAPVVAARLPRGVTTVERMLRRGRTSLRRLVAHPSVVGYAWSRWCDRTGEQPPLARGLVHVDGAAAREHTELVADINVRIPTLRPFS